VARDTPGWGSPGDFFPTLLVLGVLSVVWGLVQFRDGTTFFGLALVAPLAVGMLSGATSRMIFGRERGGVGAVGGAGAGLFLVMWVISIVAAKLSIESADATFDPPMAPILMGMGLGFVGAFLGALSLAHYRVSGQAAPDEDTDDLEDDEEEDEVDYTTEPEELVCLLTNQVVNRDHDVYVVCHNRMNVTQVCHAVYLKDYVHLLEGRCRRCYQPLRERDLKGMSKP
jgi:hypothetical protein